MKLYVAHTEMTPSRRKKETLIAPSPEFALLPERQDLRHSKQTVTGAVGRAFSILEFLNSSQRGWNISEMSRKLRIPKSTTHVLVSTLDQLGYIRRYQSSRRFQLSPKMFGLGRDALRTLPLPEIAIPHLQWLVQSTRLAAHVGILEKRQVVFIQKVEGPGIIKFDTYIGKCSELHCTALGKSLLAFQSEETIQAILSKYSFHRFTKKTISTQAALLEELSRVRQNGYSMDNEEEELGVRCIASPILVAGKAAAAVSVTGTTSQIYPEVVDKLITTIKRLAARISASLENSAQDVSLQKEQRTFSLHKAQG
jgi:IclR family KDG regulon transcriptional repressor